MSKCGDFAWRRFTAKPHLHDTNQPWLKKLHLHYSWVLITKTCFITMIKICLITDVGRTKNMQSRTKQFATKRNKYSFKLNLIRSIDEIQKGNVVTCFFISINSVSILYSQQRICISEKRKARKLLIVSYHCYLFLNSCLPLNVFAVILLP